MNHFHGNPLKLDDDTLEKTYRILKEASQLFLDHIHTIKKGIKTQKNEASIQNDSDHSTMHHAGQFHHAILLLEKKIHQYTLLIKKIKNSNNAFDDEINMLQETCHQRLEVIYKLNNKITQLKKKLSDLKRIHFNTIRNLHDFDESYTHLQSEINKLLELGKQFNESTLSFSRKSILSSVEIKFLRSLYKKKLNHIFLLTKKIQLQNKKLSRRKSKFYFLTDWKIFHYPFHLLKRIRFRIQRFFTPKLGQLQLYSPRTMITPNHYYKKIHLEKWPLISIVTPSLNQGIFLKRTIESIIEQDYPQLEYIIQDGGSTDDSLQIMRDFSSFIKHTNSCPDRGQSHALNLGFQFATGEIMAYLNSDDILLPGALQYIAHYFSKHPNVDVVYGHRIIINENDKEIGRWVLPPHDKNVLFWADFIPQETLFWRRSLWEKVGGKINEDFQFAMDWELLLRFQMVGAKFVRLPRFLGAFRVHTQQKTSLVLSKKGAEEMKRLRYFYHQRKTSHLEIMKKIKPYLTKHLIYHKLYRAGFLRY